MNNSTKAMLSHLLTGKPIRDGFVPAKNALRERDWRGIIQAVNFCFGIDWQGSYTQ